MYSINMYLPRNNNFIRIREFYLQFRRYVIRTYTFIRQYCTSNYMRHNDYLKNILIGRRNGIVKILKYHTTHHGEESV